MALLQATAAGATTPCVTGGINKVASAAGGSPVWQTTIHAASSGGDFNGGSYDFIFTSGAGNGNPWGNVWKDVNVVNNTIQTYNYQGSNNNNITLVNGNYYTNELGRQWLWQHQRHLHAYLSCADRLDKRDTKPSPG